MQLVLSIFPGIDLLGRGFEAEGFAVVRGPDLIFGQDVRSFHVPAGKFAGVVGGPPCQDFSKARRSEPTGYGVEMLIEFARVVTEAAPDWWLLENVERVPDVQIAGYVVQRIDLDAREAGLAQRRRRHFQFGRRAGQSPLVISRSSPSRGVSQRTCLAVEGSQTERRSWPDFCELQGLPREFDLPGWPIAFKYRAVGNGVPVPVAQMIARAIAQRDATAEQAPGQVTTRVCVCGCARPVFGNQQAALAACRKRLERRRKAERATTSCAVQSRAVSRDFEPS
jgi:DNA (cytosine-5)-methyltransferase 1